VVVGRAPLRSARPTTTEAVALQGRGREHTDHQRNRKGHPDGWPWEWCHQHHRRIQPRRPNSLPD